MARANSRLTRNAEVHYEEIDDIDEVDERDEIVVVISVVARTLDCKTSAISILFYPCHRIKEVSVIRYKVVIGHDQLEYGIDIVTSSQN